MATSLTQTTPSAAERRSTSTYSMLVRQRCQLQNLAMNLGYRPGRGAGAGRGIANLSAFMRDLADAYEQDPAAIVIALSGCGIGPKE